MVKKCKTLQVCVVYESCTKQEGGVRTLARKIVYRTIYVKEEEGLSAKRELRLLQPAFPLLLALNGGRYTRVARRGENELVWIFACTHHHSTLD